VQVNLVAQHSTAHLLGRVLDSGGAPVSDLQILAVPQNSGSAPSATTAADGSFDIAVLGGTWNLQLETGGAAQRNLIGPSLIYDITDGMNISNITYVVRSSTARISGSARHHSSPITFVNCRRASQSTINYSRMDKPMAAAIIAGCFNGNMVGISDGDLGSRGLETPAIQIVTVSGGV
jgi:hypothetical protein